MREVKGVAFFLALSLILSPVSFAQTASPSQQQDNQAVTLTAQKVDPSELAKEEAAAAKAQAGPVQPKKKKPLPIYLQPVEFVISSVAHAIFFWKKGDELN